MSRPRIALGGAMPLLLAALLATAAWAMVPGDLDGDTDVDTDDIGIILAARNTPASGLGDPKDIDGDGTITLNDARQAVLLCTRPLCVIGNNAPSVSDQVFSVDENVPNGTSVGTVGASDPDGDSVTFAITAGNTSGAFAISASTGEITVANSTALDFETTPQFNLTVEVTDPSAATDTATVTIDLNDIPEGPTITTAAAVNAAENQTAVVDVDSTDPGGETEGAGLTYTLTGGADQALFAIDANTGILTFLAAPDFEAPADANTDNVYEVEVTVTNTTPLTGLRTFLVTVTGVNEAPTITSDGGGPTAAVNAAENQVAVTTVTAADPEVPAQTLTFSITGGADQALFGIVSGTGVLTFNAAPNFENPQDAGTDNVYDVQVTVTDSGAPNLTDVQDIAVTVTDVNDAPIITSNGGGATASVNAAENQTAVTTVTATDADLPAQTLTFSITGGADALLFGIVPATGVLTFNAAPNFENPLDAGTDNVYDVQVTVTDNGAPNLTDVQDIAVTVTDVNDAPIITSDGGGASASVNAAENQTAVTTVTATDADLPAQTLTFSITGGADQAFFGIVSATGVLTFNAPPNFENPGDAGTNNVYDVQVTVTDNGAPNLTDVQDIAVTVTDVNDAPTITSDGGGATAAVNAAENQTAVTTVTATDPDVPAQTLTFSITGGADLASFSIVSATGVLTFNAAPDFENPLDAGGNNVYDVQVTVTDNGAPNLSDVQDIAVTVTGENDAPTITSDGGSATAAVSAAENQTAVTTVTATDADLPAQTLTFSITGGADQAFFGIVSATGVLTFNAPPNFENPGDAGTNNVYDVQVTVTDNGAPNLSDIQDIAVTVTDVNDAPTITSDGGAATAAVNAAENQTAVTTVTATDADLPAQTLTFSITGGADLAFFSIVSATGVLTFNAAPDFETPSDAGGNNVYDVQVTVTDNGAPNLSDVQDIAVTVTNVNEAPMITSSATPSAAENQTLAIDVSSSDPESETEGGGGLTYSITGGADMGLFAIDTNSGVLSFLVAPDFENPLDADTNNVYVVQVTVTDAGLLVGMQTIMVTVTDVNEAPRLVAGGLKLIEFQQDGVGPIDGLDGAASVTVSPDGKHVYAAGGADSAVAVFSRASATGALTFVEVQLDGVGPVDGLGGANSVAVSPDGRHVYVAGTTDNAVAVFSRNSTSGALSFVEFPQDGVGGVDGLGGAASVTVSSDGRHVYVAGTTDNAVAVFSRNQTTGVLTFLEFRQDGAGGVDGLAAASSVTLSPDGNHLYATGGADNAVAAFSRNSASGLLTFVEFQQDGGGGGTELAGANDVAVSPGGLHVYVVATNDDSITTFSRNPGTGALTLVGFLKDGVAGVDGLDAASSVTVSPDGRHVYATGTAENAAAAFSRNPTTGALTFLESLVDGIGGVDGLGGAASVAVSSDSGHLYTAGATDDAIAVFSRQDRTVQFIAPNPVSILDTGIDLTVTDIDSATLASATVTITNLLDAPDEILAAIASGGIVAGDIVYTPATGVLSIVPATPQSLADFQAVLRSVTYDNDAAPPDATTRLVTAVVNDGALVGPLDSNTFTAMVTLNTAPIAVDDTYIGQPVNVVLDAGSMVATGIEVNDPDGVLSKGTDDSDPEGDTLTVTMVNATVVPGGGSASATTAGGGTVTMSSDGTFVYVSEPGEVAGSDTFTYELSDGSLTDTGTVTINFTGEIWFIDNNVTGGLNDGRSNSPFETTTAFNAANGGGAGKPAIGDVVFLRTGSGTAYTPGITLLDTQTLNGENEALTVGALTTTVGTAPSLAPATGNGIVLGSGNTIRGLDIGNTPAGHALSGAAVGALVLSNVEVSGTGGILEITTSGMLNGVTFASLASTSTAAGDSAISLTGISGGTFNLGSPTISGTTAAGVSISNSTASFTFGSVTIDGTGGNGIDILGTNTGTFTFGAGTSIGATTSPTGVGINIDGNGSTSNAAVTFSGNVTQTNNQPAVMVKDHSTGTIAFQTGTISATSGTGLQFSNADGTYNFNGTATLNGGDAGIDILNGSAGTFTFASTTITTPTGTAFNLVGGTASVTYNGNITKANAGAAVSISGGHTTGTVTFQTGTISATAGTGLQFDNADSTTSYNFNGPTTLNGGDAGIDILNGSAGTFTFGANTTITSPTGTAFNLVGGTASVTYNGSITKANAGAAVSISGGHTTGTVTFQTGTISATSGTGLQFDNADSTTSYNFNGPTTLNGGDAGIDILNGSAGTFTFGANTTITSPTGTAFNADSSAANVTYSGSITQNNVATGVRLNSNTGTVTFRGGLILNTGSAIAFNASGGGAVNVCATNDCAGGVAVTNTIGTMPTPITGTGVNITNTNIGASGVTFRSIYVNGATKGIILNSTGTSGGGFTVTGTGTTDGSGGTITAVTQRGADINTAHNVTLKNMNFTMTTAMVNGADPTNPNSTCGGLLNGGNLGCNAAIHLVSTTNVVLDNLDVTDSPQQGINGNNVDGLTLTNLNVLRNGNQTREDGLRVRDLQGTVSITGTIFDANASDQVHIVNSGVASPTSVALPSFTMSGSTLRDSQAPDGANGIKFEFVGTATATVVLDGNIFSDLRSDGFLFDATDNAAASIEMKNNTMDNSHSGGRNNGIGQITSNLSANVTFNVHDNPKFESERKGLVINQLTQSSTTGKLIGRVEDNPNMRLFGVGATLVSDSSVIDVKQNGAGTLTVLIDGNTIVNDGHENAIGGIAREDLTNSGVLNMTVNNNTVSTTNVNNGSDGIGITRGTSDPTHTNKVCADITNNTASSLGRDAIRVRQFEPTTFEIEGLTGSGTSATNVESFLASVNSATTPAGINALLVTAGFIASASPCPTPP